MQMYAALPLVFADDLMLFCKADQKSIQCLVDRLEEFAGISQLEVNKDKSHVIIDGIKNVNDKNILLQLTGCT